MPAVAQRRKPRRGQPRVAYKGDRKPEVIREILAGVPRSKAGPAAGVTKETFYEWLASDQQFLIDVEAAEAKRIKNLLKRGASKSLGSGAAAMIRTLLRPLAQEFRQEAPLINVSASASASASGNMCSPELLAQIQAAEKEAREYAGRN